MGLERVDDAPAQRGRLPRAGEEVEVERRVQLVGPEVAGEALAVGQPDLADEHARRLVGVGDAPPAAVQVVQLVAVDERVVAGRVDRVDLGQVGVLHRQGGRVDAHAGRAAVEPEAQHVLVLAPDVGVLPVEVGLARREQVEVPVAGRAVGILGPGPGDVAEVRRPAVRRQVAVGAAAGAEPEAVARGEPGPAASACSNQACWSDTWLGTMSTIVRMPRSRASWMNASASASVPNDGSMAR